MKRILAFVIMLLLLGNQLLHAVEKNKITVTYIANEGFLIESSGKKILIDALHGKDYISESDVPSAETLNKLSTAQPPFDNVDLIFVTHQHQDHFDSGLVIKHLISNNHCQIVGPQQVVDQLKSSDNFKKIKKRVHSITPPFAHRENSSLNGIEFSVIRLKHISKFYKDKQTGKPVNRHGEVQNLGFLINMGSHKILHIGDSDLRDAEAEYKHFQFAQEKIDIAFLTKWFLGFSGPNESSINIINNHIKPQRIVLMHFNKRSFFQNVKYYVTRKIHQGGLAPVTILSKELEKKEFYY